MKADVRERWVRALRSGKYKQGWGRLCSVEHGETSFCCIGVLANEELNGHWIEESEGLQGFHRKGLKIWWEFYYDGSLFGETGSLNNDALAELELSDFHQFKLTEMNDSGCSFSEIADWIEENL